MAAQQPARECPDTTLAEQVKTVHRRYPTGVTVVTSTLGGRPFGLAVNAFTSLSVEPPTVLVCISASSASHAGFHASDQMAVNILAHDQADVAELFGRPGAGRR